MRPGIIQNLLGMGRVKLTSIQTNRVHHLLVAEVMDQCDNHSDYFNQLFYAWYNYSNFNSSQNFQAYVCSYVAYQNLYNTLNWTEGLLHCICAIAGIISSILTLITICKNKNFSSHAFCYFRVIAISEILVSCCLFNLGIGLMQIDIRISFSWIWLFYKVTDNLGNMLSTYVEVLITYLSTERGIACLLPTKFHFIDNRKTVYKVCIIAIFPLLLLYVPGVFAYQIVYQLSSYNYVAVPTNSSFEIWTRAREVVEYILAACIIASSIFSILGLMRALKLR